MIFETKGLLEPQHEHGRRLANSLVVNRISWDGTVTGGGKTYTAGALARFLSGLDLSGRKVFVICPRKVKGTWRDTLKQFGVVPQDIVNLEKLVRGSTKWLKYRRATKQERADGIEEMMLTVLKIPSDWIVLIDEAHRCKGISSLSAGVLMALKRQGYQFHMMSATLATSPLDMRASGYAFGLHDGSMREFKKFCINAGAEWKGHHGAMRFNDDCPIAKAKMKEVHHYLFHVKKIGSRLERRDFKGIFPNNQIIADAYDMGENSDKIQAVYDELEYELARLEESCGKYQEHVLAAMIKARRKAEMFKVPTLVELALDSYEDGHSPILFMNFTDTIVAVNERLAKAIGQDLICQIHGERTERQQLSELAEFQSDKRRAILANIASGGESINAHDLNGQFPRDQIINPSWNAIKVLQSVGRADRAHAKTDVITRFVFADRTIEVPICRRFQSRKDNIDLLNNGDLIPSERIFRLGGAGKDI
jgi:hypothetical protein